MQSGKSKKKMISPSSSARWKSWDNHLNQTNKRCWVTANHHNIQNKNGTNAQTNSNGVTDQVSYSQLQYNLQYQQLLMQSQQSQPISNADTNKLRLQKIILSDKCVTMAVFDHLSIEVANLSFDEIYDGFFVAPNANQDVNKLDMVLKVYYTDTNETLIKYYLVHQEIVLHKNRKSTALLQASHAQTQSIQFEVEVSVTLFDIFDSVILYMYENNICVDDTRLIPLYVLMKRLGINGGIIDGLLSDIRVCCDKEHCIPFLLQSEELECEELMRLCRDIILQNLHAITSENYIAEMPQTTFNQLIFHSTNADKDIRQHLLGSIIKYESYKYKNVTLDWNRFKQILTHKEWSSKWRLGDQLYESNQTLIYSTEITHLSDYKIPFFTKVYKYSNNKEVMKIWQTYAVTRSLRLLYYSDIAFGKNECEIYMTMEALNYTLVSAVKSERIELSYFILEIAGNLHQLHSNNYIHLGLTPNNCAFRDYDRQQYFPLGNGWKLMDWDLLKYVRNSDKSDCIRLNDYIGSVGWSAPEISPYATKEKPNIVSAKADIWSFGLLILYIINDGKHIFDLSENELKHFGKTEILNVFYAKLMKFNMKSYLKKLWMTDKINEGLYELLSSMLNYSPNRRISAAEIVKHKYFSKYVTLDKESGVYYIDHSMRENETRFKNQSQSRFIPLIYKTPKFPFNVQTC